MTTTATTAPDATGVPLLSVSDLTVTYAPPRRKGSLGTGAALSGVDLEIYPGEIVGIVGETGSGKTTLARATVGLVKPAQGRIDFDGDDLGSLRGRALRDFRRAGQVQLAFQDPLRSLDSDLRVAELVGEPLAVAGELDRDERRRRVDEALQLVGLDPASFRDRYPRALSGGQRQRVSLARAIVTRPRLLFCDEPVSALDVSVQAQIVNLLADLQRELGLAQLFVAHDLSVVRQVADRVAVMYLGRIVERGPTATIFARPRHPYSKALLSAVPIADPHRRQGPAAALGGEPPSPIDPPPACHFHTRCPRATEICKTVQPPLWRYADGAAAACHHPHDTSEADIAAGSRDATSPIAAGDVAPDATGGRP